MLERCFVRPVLVVLAAVLALGAGRVSAASHRTANFVIDAPLKTARFFRHLYGFCCFRVDQRVFNGCIMVFIPLSWLLTIGPLQVSRSNLLSG